MPSIEDRFCLITASSVFVNAVKGSLEKKNKEIYPEVKTVGDKYKLEVESDLFSGSCQYQADYMLNLLKKCISDDPAVSFSAQWELDDTVGDDVASIEFSYSGNNQTLTMSGMFSYYYESTNKSDGFEDCSGKKFAVSGEWVFFDSDEEFSDYIESWDGIVVETISSETDYLICNDYSHDSGKKKKAAELGIPVITEIDFIEQFGDPAEFPIEQCVVPSGEVVKKYVYHEGNWKDLSPAIRYRYNDPEDYGY